MGVDLREVAMDGRTDSDVVRELRAHANAAVPSMALDRAAVRAAGRRRLLGRRLAAGVSAVALVGAIAVGVTWSGWLGRGTGVPPAGASAGASLQLRLVVSSTTGGCTAPALRGEAPGSACDIDGTTTYQLGEALGDLTPTSTSIVRDDHTGLDLTFSRDDTATLTEVTGNAVGQRLAMLVDGRVIGAPQVMEPITLDQIEIAFGTAAQARFVAAMLDGTLKPAPDTVAVYQPQGTGGDAALLTGTLTLRDGCTYVVDENGTTWLPIFARGVTADDTTLTYGGETYPYGSTVSLTGGQSGAGPTDAIPASCSTDAAAWRVTPPG